MAAFALSTARALVGAPVAASVGGKATKAAVNAASRAVPAFARVEVTRRGLSGFARLGLVAAAARVPQTRAFHLTAFAADEEADAAPAEGYPYPRAPLRERRRVRFLRERRDERGKIDDDSPRFAAPSVHGDVRARQTPIAGRSRSVLLAVPVAFSPGARPGLGFVRPEGTRRDYRRDYRRDRRRRSPRDVDVSFSSPEDSVVRRRDVEHAHHPANVVAHQQKIVRRGDGDAADAIVEPEPKPKS